MEAVAEREKSQLQQALQLNNGNEPAPGRRTKVHKHDKLR